MEDSSKATHFDKYSRSVVIQSTTGIILYLFLAWDQALWWGEKAKNVVK